jgi:hypothetical protein
MKGELVIRTNPYQQHEPGSIRLGDTIPSQESVAHRLAVEHERPGSTPVPGVVPGVSPGTKHVCSDYRRQSSAAIPST